MQNIRKVLSYNHIVISNGHVNTKPHMQKEQYNGTEPFPSRQLHNI